ncbi:MAG: hypothetical protein SOU19_02655 [Candidatus Caccosoma sp.]|nr:hypothetical protein [Candidatus Caccosoma sp.]
MKKTIYLDIIYSKISYILACLNNYTSLDLSKRIKDINDNIYLIKKGFIDNKAYVDIRNVISLRENLDLLKNRIQNIDDKVMLEGHKISCLLFETSKIIELFLEEFNLNDLDLKEYLLLASKYLYFCGRIINIEILSYEKKEN